MTRILKTATCPTVSDASNLTYEIGCNDKSEIHFRISGNTGGGMFGDEWVAWGLIQPATGRMAEMGRFRTFPPPLTRIRNPDYAVGRKPLDGAGACAVTKHRAPPLNVAGVCGSVAAIMLEFRVPPHMYPIETYPIVILEIDNIESI